MRWQRTRFVRSAVSLVGLAAVIAFSSCGDKTGRPRSGRTSESAAAEFVLREDIAPRSSQELAIGEVEEPPAMPTPREAPRPPRLVVAKATVDKALLDEIERSLNVEPHEDIPAPLEPQPLPEEHPALPVRPRSEQQAPSPTPPRAQRDFSTEKNAALIGGSMALVVASAAASGDGTTGERVMAVSFLGVGVAAFATVGVLTLMETAPNKPAKPTKPTAGITFRINPGGVGGSF